MSTLAEQIAALTLPPMTERDHAKYMGLSWGQFNHIKSLGKITDEDLAFNEQARAIETLAPLWESGAEPYPSDVSVNRRRGRHK